MNIQKLEYIEHNKIPNILLLGNGLNRAYGDGSWANLIDKMSCRHFDGKYSNNIKKLPYPLQTVLLTGNNVNEGAEYVSKELINAGVTEECSGLLRKLIANHFDTILTTNYTYEIEKSLASDFSCYPKRFCSSRYESVETTKRDQQFGLYSYMQINHENETKRIWHIHGEAAKPPTMILGHDYYVRLASQIYAYMNVFRRRYEGMKKNPNGFLPQSWIDYFMISNVYIIGLGLDPSEVDLWWLINAKNQFSKLNETGKIVWYEPNLDRTDSFSKKMLAEIYDIQYRTEEVDDDGYRDYFNRVVEKVVTDMSVGY